MSILITGTKVETSDKMGIDSFFLIFDFMYSCAFDSLHFLDSNTGVKPVIQPIRAKNI